MQAWRAAARSTVGVADTVVVGLLVAGSGFPSPPSLLLPQAVRVRARTATAAAVMVRMSPPGIERVGGHHGAPGGVSRGHTDSPSVLPSMAYGFRSATRTHRTVLAAHTASPPHRRLSFPAPRSQLGCWCAASA